VILLQHFQYDCRWESRVQSTTADLLAGFTVWHMPEPACHHMHPTWQLRRRSSVKHWHPLKDHDLCIFQQQRQGAELPGTSKSCQKHMQRVDGADVQCLFVTGPPVWISSTHKACTAAHSDLCNEPTPQAKTSKVHILGTKFHRLCTKVRALCYFRPFSEEGES
jgi:hypothetical protein